MNIRLLLLLIVVSSEAIGSIIEVQFDNGWLVEVDDEISNQSSPWPDYTVTYFGQTKVLNTGNDLPGTFFSSGAYVEDSISLPDYGIGFFERHHSIGADGATYASINSLHMLEGNGVGELNEPIVLSNILDSWISRSFFFDSSYEAVTVSSGITTLESWNYKFTTVPEPSSILLLISALLGLLICETHRKSAVT